MRVGYAVGSRARAAWGVSGTGWGDIDGGLGIGSEMGRTAAATADLTAAAVARAGGASTAQGAGEATTAGRGMRVLNPSFPSRKLISDVAWELRARSKRGRRSRLCDTRSVRWRLLSSLLIRRGAA